MGQQVLAEFDLSTHFPSFLNQLQFVTFSTLPAPFNYNNFPSIIFSRKILSYQILDKLYNNNNNNNNLESSLVTPFPVFPSFVLDSSDYRELL